MKKIIYHNIKCINEKDKKGVVTAKCLCSKCRVSRNWNFKNVQEKKPDLSRAAEMERRKSIYDNKDIW